MGKKRKFKKSEWNMSAEEQEQLADVLYELEQGGDSSGTVLDMMKIKTPGRTMGVESAVLYDKVKELKESNPDTYGTSDDGSISYSDFASGKVPKEKSTLVPPSKKKESTEAKPSDNYGVFIKMSPLTNIFRRISVEDGVTSTPIYLPALHSYKVDLSEISKSDVIETIECLIRHIVLLSHPMAIFTGEEFFEHPVISRLNDFDKKKFKFFYFTPSIEGGEETTYISCYYVKYDSFMKLAEFMKNIPLENLFAVYIMIAKVCSYVSRVFLMEDEEYVDTFKKSSLNQTALFTDLLKNDKMTDMDLDPVDPDTLTSFVDDAFGIRNDMFDWLDNNVADYEDLLDDEEDDDDEDEEEAGLEGEDLMKNALKEDDYKEPSGFSSVEQFFEENPDKLKELDEASGNGSDEAEDEESSEEEEDSDEKKRLQAANERYAQITEKYQNSCEEKVTNESNDGNDGKRRDIEKVDATSETGDIIVKKHHR